MERDRATIRRLIGDVAVQPLPAGLDHRVYALGDALMARFGDGAAREAALLTAIAPLVPLPVPVPIAVDAEAGCLVFPRAPGTLLLDVPRAARRPFVAQLLAFADAVHALDPDGDVPVDDVAPADWLVDAGRITGVIDWGDAAMGDPALDHGRLMRDLGPIARGGERARFYAVCTALEDLAFGLESGRDSYRTNALAALEDLT